MFVVQGPLLRTLHVYNPLPLTLNGVIIISISISISIIISIVIGAIHGFSHDVTGDVVSLWPC